MRFCRSISIQRLTPLVLLDRVMTPPDSCLSGNWDPENSALSMLAPPRLSLALPTQPPPTGHLFHSEANIPHIPPPLSTSPPFPFSRTKVKEQLPPPHPPSSPPLLPRAPSYLSLPQPTAWTPSKHWPNSLNPSQSLLILGLAKPLLSSPLSER